MIARPGLTYAIASSHNEISILQKLAPRLLLLVALLLTVIIYRSGLHGPFIFDDGLNIVNNQHLRLQDFSKESLQEAAFSIPNGVFGRPLSMLSFAFNFYLDRHNIEPFPSAYSFKLANLGIHLLNGLAIFMLTRLLIALYRERRRPDLPATYPTWLALAVASAWLLHPLNLTSVLYVVQRMASLAALFTFIGLGVYLWGRTRLCSGRRWGMLAITASLLVFAPIAVLSKENGILLPFFMLAAEVVLFRFEADKPSGRRLLLVFFTALLVLPTVLTLGYLAQHPDSLLGGYARRDFNLIERLMTEARVIWFYLRLIVLPSTAQMGIYHDDIAISRQLLEPASTLPAILGVLALPVVAWSLRRRQPLVAFGILFFLLGHSIESTIYPLELVHEHRNYLPMFGILLAFFHLLLDPLTAVSTKPLRRILALLLIPLFAVGTLSRANAWSNDYDLWTLEVEHHPDSIRANLALADLYANALTRDPAAKAGNYQLARKYYERTLTLDRYDTNGLFGLIQLSKVHGRSVERAWLDDLNYSLEHQAIPSNTNERLISLAMCTTEDTCPLKAQDIDPLMRAPLRNVKVTGRDRALIYNAMTVYFFNVTHDYQAAVESTRQAIALDPQDIENSLWLATILLAMHRPDEARKQITVLRQLDPRNMRAKDIGQLEDQLNHGN